MLRTILLCLLVSLSAPALAVFKCKSANGVVYRDQECPGGTALPIDSNPDMAEAAKAAQQTSQEKKQLQRLENERRRREAQEEKERQRAAHAYAVKQKRCATLARRKQWAEEDAAAATGKSIEKAKVKARRVTQVYEDECGK